MSIAGGQSFAHVSMNASQRNGEGSRRFSAPNIGMECVPARQGPTAQPPPKQQKPPKPALKLYPWMTRREIPPPKGLMLQCQYPTNDCTETLHKNMGLWRKHLAEKHGLKKDDTLQTCQWPGCGRTMGGRSLNRHVSMTHMDLKTNCPYCMRKRRPDHLEKHVEQCSYNPAREKRWDLI